MMDPAHRRYVIRTSMFMAGYALLSVAAMMGAFDDVSGPGAWGLGLVAAAPLAGQMWATLALIRDSDEFVRALTARRFIVASGLSMALFCAWGFVESYAEAPHAPGWLIFPLFWMMFGLVSPFVRSTRG